MNNTKEFVPTSNRVESKSSNVAVRLTSKQNTELREFAERYDKTLTDVIISALTHLNILTK